MKFKYLINDMIINIGFFLNFGKKCNPLVDLLKITSNKKILSKILAIDYSL